MKTWMVIWVALLLRFPGAGAAEPVMEEIPAGINTGTDPDFGSYSLTNALPFFMDKYEVTNDEMVRVMQWAYDTGRILAGTSSVQNATGSGQELLDLDDPDCQITWDGSDFGLKTGKSTNYPCVEVSWYGAAAYCNYRSEMEGKTVCYNFLDWSCNFNVDGYRLPTNEEREYAARGGLVGQRFPWGNTITHSNANYFSNASCKYDTSAIRGYHPGYDDGSYPYTSPVANFAANGYGLHDMAGNVWEWCWDASGPYRYIRGGGWVDDADCARCGGSGWFSPRRSDGRIGFRAVCREGMEQEPVSRGQ